jgi:hypothetical protein
MRQDNHIFLKNGSEIFFAEGLDRLLIKRSDLPDGCLAGGIAMTVRRAGLADHVRGGSASAGERRNPPFSRAPSPSWPLAEISARLDLADARR